MAEFDETSHRAEDLSDAIADLRPATTPPYAVLNLDPDRPWTGMVRVAPEETSLPHALVAEYAVSLSLAGSPNDDTLAATVEDATGIPVRFTGIRPRDAPDDPFHTTPAAFPEGGIWTGSLDVLLDSWTTSRGYRWHCRTASVSSVRDRQPTPSTPRSEPCRLPGRCRGSSPPPCPA